MGQNRYKNHFMIFFDHREGAQGCPKSAPKVPKLGLGGQCLVLELETLYFYNEWACRLEK